MESMNLLIERHVRESMARLAHVDEMMNRARSAGVSLSEDQKVKLQDLAADRDKAAKVLQSAAQSVGPGATETAEAASLVARIGLELEHMLAAIFESR